MHRWDWFDRMFVHIGVGWQFLVVGVLGVIDGVVDVEKHHGVCD